jgi:hypothetical protein
MARGNAAHRSAGSCECDAVRASPPRRACASYQRTYLTYPWIVAIVGTGDTLLQGTGTLVGGFSAQTANSAQSEILADTAYIGAVPELPTVVMAIAGLAVLGWRGRRLQ